MDQVECWAQWSSSVGDSTESAKPLWNLPAAVDSHWVSGWKHSQQPGKRDAPWCPGISELNYEQVARSFFYANMNMWSFLLQLLKEGINSKVHIKCLLVLIGFQSVNSNQILCIYLHNVFQLISNYPTQKEMYAYMGLELMCTDCIIICSKCNSIILVFGGELKTVFKKNCILPHTSYDVWL